MIGCATNNCTSTNNMDLEKQFRLVYEENPSPSDEAILFNGIVESAAINKGMGRTNPFAYFIKDQNDKIVAGLKGFIYYGCLEIDLLWVADEFRHKGWGTILIRETENLGREKNCKFISVNTMEWEALTFYQKLGYQIEFVQGGYEKDTKMCYLRKNL